MKHEIIYFYIIFDSVLHIKIIIFVITLFILINKQDITDFVVPFEMSLKDL